MSDAVEDDRPLPPSWINKDFFETAMKSGDQDPTITVVDFTMKMANAVGDNYCSVMYRATVDYRRGTGPLEKRSLIVKCQPIGGMKEEVIKDWNMFPTETHMFTQVLPELSKILEEAAPGKFKRFGAKCLYHGMDPIQFIVLEDLAPLGFKVAKRWNGLDLKQSKAIMNSIGQFHAASIALQDKTPDLMEPYLQNVYNENTAGTLGKVLNSSFKSVAQEIDKHTVFDRTYSNRLLKLSDTLFARSIELNKYKEGRFNVLNHGDLWVNNVLFNDGDGVVFVDFQVTHLTSPAIDLLYFINTSLNEEVYLNCQEELLLEYHTALTDSMRLLGYGDKCISMDQLKKEMDDHGLHGLFSTIISLPIVRADGEDVFDIGKSVDETQSSSYSGIYSSPRYLEALKMMLPLFDSKGLF